jgi:hypothetical protein
MHGGLLVPDQDVLDLILLEQFVINEEDGAARVAEDVFGLFFLQTPDYNLSASQQHVVRFPQVIDFIRKLVTLTVRLLLVKAWHGESIDDPGRTRGYRRWLPD